MYKGCHAKYPLFLSDLLIFFQQIFKKKKTLKNQISRKSIQ